jgi:ubiquinone/menaquinone biosynthesis C-methylase UbiE
MVVEAMTLTPEASFYTAPAEALPFPSSSVDLEVSSISLHHWSDPLIALMEIAQVLRPGGRLSLADITLPGWIAKLIDSKAKTREGLRQLVTIAGLTPVQQRTMLANIVLVLGAKKGPRIPD